MLAFRTAVMMCFFALPIVSEHVKAAIVVDNFADVNGASTGEFGWDVFAGTYAGPHLPDQGATGVGSASLSVNPGGLLDSGSTGDDLYSFFSVPAWTISLSSLSGSSD